MGRRQLPQRVIAPPYRSFRGEKLSWRREQDDAPSQFATIALDDGFIGGIEVNRLSFHRARCARAPRLGVGDQRAVSWHKLLRRQPGQLPAAAEAAPFFQQAGYAPGLQIGKRAGLGRANSRRVRQPRPHPVSDL